MSTLPPLALFARRRRISRVLSMTRRKAPSTSGARTLYSASPKLLLQPNHSGGKKYGKWPARPYRLPVILQTLSESNILGSKAKDSEPANSGFPTFPGNCHKDSGLLRGRHGPCVPTAACSFPPSLRVGPTWHSASQMAGQMIGQMTGQMTGQIGQMTRQI